MGRRRRTGWQERGLISKKSQVLAAPYDSFGFYQNIESALGTAVGGSLNDGTDYEIVVSMWVHDEPSGTPSDNDNWRETAGANDVGKAETNLGIGLANTSAISTADFSLTESFWYTNSSKSSFLPTVATDGWRQWSRTYTVTHAPANDYFFFFGANVINGPAGQRVTLPQVTIQDLSASTAIPEPSALAICLLGTCGLLGRTFRRRR